VFRGCRPKLHFLELRAAAALALLMSLFVLLIKKLAVVGDLANRRIGGGRNLHQVESTFAGHANRFEGLHHTELAAYFVNHANFARADAFVNARAVALPEIPICDISPFSTSCFAAELQPTGTFARFTVRQILKSVLVSIAAWFRRAGMAAPITLAKISQGRVSKYSTQSGWLDKGLRAAVGR